MEKHLSERVAIVTGAAQGIGRGIARGLAAEGVKVIICDVNESEALATKKTIEGAGGVADIFLCDVSNMDEVKRMADYTIERFGALDIIVNNAARLGSGSIVSLTGDEWDRLTITKMRGTFNLMHCAIPFMIKQHFGRVFNCASEAWTGLVDNDAYSAANAGVVGLTYASAKELYRYGITVNAYCPQGASPGHEVEYNKMLKNIKAVTGRDPDPALLSQVEQDHGDPINLAPFIAYLCSEEAAYITGEVFAIKSSGKIGRYSYPKVVNNIERPAGSGPLWDFDELGKIFRDDVMGHDYVSHAKKSVWEK